MIPKAFTVDLSTQASKPARLKVEYLRYAKLYPLWPILILGMMFWLTASELVNLRREGSARRLTGLAFIAVFSCLAWFLIFRRAKEHFWHGDVLPGLMIGTEPATVAVLTDLTQGLGEYPALRIIRVPLRWNLLQNRPYRRGDRLSLVALYVRNARGKESGSWENFIPLPAEAASSDPVELSRLLASLSSTEWIDLSRALQAIPFHRPGLYRLINF